jgi:bifunctional DNase/RNase
MERTKLFVKGLSYSQTQTGAYALVLGEEKGERRLPIIIGGFEAQSIAIALEKEVNPPRPLTHDLFKNFADSFKLSLKEVLIHKLKDGVFYSILVCEGNGEEKMLDARTSDAVALAIRFKAPIFTYEEILEKAGVILKDGESSGSKSTIPSRAPSAKKAQSKDKPMSAKTLADLNKELEQAVQNEDYETAARLRDEIDQREGK